MPAVIVLVLVLILPNKESVVVDRGPSIVNDIIPPVPEPPDKDKLL